MSTLEQHEGASASDVLVGAVRERIRETRRAAAEAQLRYQKGAEDLMANFAANEDQRAIRISEGGTVVEDGAIYTGPVSVFIGVGPGRYCPPRHPPQLPTLVA